MSEQSSGRVDVSMTHAEIEDFLRQRKTVVVAAVDSVTPAPIAVVAAARYVDEAVEVELPIDDPVAVALAACSSICCIAEQSPSFYEIKGVIVRGAAESRACADSARARYRVALGTPTSFDFGRLPEAPAKTVDTA